MPTRRTPQPPAARRAADAWMGLDQQLCFALYSASLAMTKRYTGPLAALGLTYPQYLVLLVLWEHGALSVGELGGRLCLDSGTLTPLLKRMQAAGLLTRERAEFDERRVVVSLTAAGEALRAQGRTVPPQIGAASGLDANGVLALTQQLQQLRERLQAAPSLQADLSTGSSPSSAPSSSPSSSPAAARKPAALSTPSH